MLQKIIKSSFRRPEIIETSKKILMNLLFPAVAMILCLLEVCLSLSINTIEKATYIVQILKELFDAGLFILIVMILYSVSFNYFLAGIRLELPNKYAERAIKGFFSQAGILTIIFYYLLIKDDPSLVGDPAFKILIQKGLSWFIAILGLWIGIDIREKKINKNGKKKCIQIKDLIQNKQKLSFCIKFIISFMISIIIYILIILGEIYIKNLEYIFLGILLILCILLAALAISGKKQMN